MADPKAAPTLTQEATNASHGYYLVIIYAIVLVLVLVIMLFRSLFMCQSWSLSCSDTYISGRISYLHVLICALVFQSWSWSLSCSVPCPYLLVLVLVIILLWSMPLSSSPGLGHYLVLFHALIFSSWSWSLSCCGPCPCCVLDLVNWS